MTDSAISKESAGSSDRRTIGGGRSRGGLMFDSAIVTDFQSSSEDDEGDGGSVRGRKSSKREGIVR